jgi:hypothetical protein
MDGLNRASYAFSQPIHRRVPRRAGRYWRKNGSCRTLRPIQRVFSWLRLSVRKRRGIGEIGIEGAAVSRKDDRFPKFDDCFIGTLLLYERLA